MDPNLECIAGLGAFDEHRPVQDVPSGSFVRDLLVNVAQRLLDLFRRDPGAFQAGGAAGDQGLELHLVTGCDFKNRGRRGIVVAPGDGLRSGLEGEGLWLPLGLGQKPGEKEQPEWSASHVAPVLRRRRERNGL